MRTMNFAILALLFSISLGCGQGFEATKFADSAAETSRPTRGISTPIADELGGVESNTTDGTDENASKWTFKTPEELGYTVSTSSACIQVVESWVKADNKTCVITTDGCEADFIFHLGFEKDREELCSELTRPL